MTEYGACSYPLYSLLGLSSVLLTRGEQETEADNTANKSSFSMMLWDVDDDFMAAEARVPYLLI